MLVMRPPLPQIPLTSLFTSFLYLSLSLPSYTLHYIEPTRPLEPPTLALLLPLFPSIYTNLKGKPHIMAAVNSVLRIDTNIKSFPWMERPRRLCA